MTFAQARTALGQERAKLRARLGLSPLATEPIERGDEAEEVAASSERVILFTTREQMRERLQAIDEALDRIAGGRYGLCIVCEQQIPGPRLRANAAAARCVPCETAFEQQLSSLRQGFRLDDPDAEAPRRKRPVIGEPEHEDQC